MSGQLTAVLTHINDLEVVENDYDFWDELRKGATDFWKELWDGIKSLGELIIENWESVLLAIVIVVSIIVVIAVFFPAVLVAVAGFLGNAMMWIGAGFLIASMFNVVKTGFETGNWGYAIGYGSQEILLEVITWGAGKLLKSGKYVDEVADVTKGSDEVADAAKNGDEIADVAKKIDLDDLVSPLSKDEIDEVARLSTHNPDSTELVLGKYVDDSELSYDAIAESRGAKYFSTGDELWSKLEHLDSDEIFKINKRVLDDAIENGDEIILTHDPIYELAKTDNVSYYFKELTHLKESGYKFVKVENGLWQAIK